MLHSFDAMIAVLKPIYMKHESERCAELDDERTTPLDCSVLEYPERNLYCQCESINSNPEEIFITRRGIRDGQDVELKITEDLLCERAESSSTAFESKHVSLHYHEDSVLQSPIFQASLQRAYKGALSASSFSTASAACIDEVLLLEQARFAASQSPDLYGSVLAGIRLAYAEIGADMSLASTVTFNRDALVAAYLAAWDGNDVATAYATVAPASLPSEKAVF